MKRFLLAVLVGLTVAPLVLAVCPPQPFLPLDGLDLAQIATDPVSGQKLVFKRLAGYTGRPVVIEGWALDPDNDDPNSPPQTITAWRGTADVASQKLTLSVEGAWQFIVTYSNDGWHYETVSASDGMLTRTGTVAVYTKTNRPPSLCGGQP